MESAEASYNIKPNYAINFLEPRGLVGQLLSHFGNALNLSPLPFGVFRAEFTADYQCLWLN